MRTRRARPALLLLDRVVVVITSLLLGGIALLSPLLVGISGMRSTGCRTACSTALVGAGGAVVIGGCVGAAALALLGLLVLARSDRYLWWLPCSALAIAGATLLIGDHLIDLGVGA